MAWRLALAKQRANQPERGGAAASLDRLASFRFTYVALLLFVVCYVFSVKALEVALERHFVARLIAALHQETDAGGKQAANLTDRLDRAISDSVWVRPGGVRVAALLFEASDNAPLYVRGARIRYAGKSLADTGAAPRGVGEVLVSVPHNSLAANVILVFYAAALVQTLFLFTRRRARLEDEQLRAALGDREQAAQRAAEIEARLVALSARFEQRLAAEVKGELQGLDAERDALERQLGDIASREAALRSQAGQLTRSLEEERTALEELLEEATGDLEEKERLIRTLEGELERASRRTPRARRNPGAVRRRLETRRRSAAHHLVKKTQRSLVHLF